MEREVTPEPPPEDEEAIEAALARLLRERVDPRSEWWRAGVREDLELELELDGPTGNILPSSERLQSFARRCPRSPAY